MAKHTCSFPVTHSIKVGSLEAVRDHPESQREMTQVPAHPPGFPLSVAFRVPCSSSHSDLPADLGPALSRKDSILTEQLPQLPLLPNLKSLQEILFIIQWGSPLIAPFLTRLHN